MVDRSSRAMSRIRMGRMIAWISSFGFLFWGRVFLVDNKILSLQKMFTFYNVVEMWEKELVLYV